MNTKNWKLKDVLLIAISAVLFGVVYLGCTYIGGVLYGMLTPFGMASLGYEPFYGIYFMAGAFGIYVVVGKLVLVQGVLALTSKGSATGNASVSGLPITSAASQSAWHTLAWQNMTSSYVNMIGYVTTSVTTISIRGITAAATSNIANVTEAGFANNSILYIHGTYRAA